MSIKNRHYFWGSDSALGGFAGIGLLIMASSRLSWAVTVSICLFWVYGLTSLTYSFLTSAACKKIFPRAGRNYVFTCIACLFGSLYMFLFWLLSPFAVFEIFVPLLLIPLFCAVSEIPGRINALSEKNIDDIFENVTDAVSQAAVLSGLLIVFSIIREPLAYNSLSLPGTNQGMVIIFSFNPGNFFPIGILASSAGALLLLGYIVCMYQYYKDINFREL